MSNPYNAYLKNIVETASPLAQVIMLYERAILALMQAKEDIKRKDIKAKIANINKASDIISALNASLDMQRGGEIAQNLRELYDFVGRSLFEVHSKNDLGLLDDIIEILGTLKSGWEQIESKI